MSLIILPQVSYQDSKHKKQVTKYVPSDLKDIAVSLCFQNKKRLSHVIMQNQTLYMNIFEILMKAITDESKRIVTEPASKFVNLEISDIRKSNYMETLYNEMETKCPLTYSFLRASAYNFRQLSKNKLKTFEAVRNPTLQAFGLLLNIRNERAIAVQAINAIILRRGGADKQTFGRLNSACISVNYKKVLALQDELGEGYDDRGKAWMKDSESPEKNEVDQFNLAL